MGLPLNGDYGDGWYMIENPGTSPPEHFTMFGASDAGGSNAIGQFGSGVKHGILTLLRHGLSPSIFIGLTRLTFFRRPLEIAGQNGQPQYRICVRYQGKLPNGKSKNCVEELSYTAAYGAVDWTTPEMALREFVSNALDSVIKADRPYTDVRITNIRDPGMVRARDGYTRVFVPATPTIKKFFDRIGDWFLHFSADPSQVNQLLLPKASRNFDSEGPVVYRRGVRVRELSGPPSVYDYNFHDVAIDECRNSDEYALRHRCGRAAATELTDDQLISLLRRMANDNPEVWESQISQYTLMYELSADRAADCFKRAFGENAVLVLSPKMAERVAERGYVPIQLPSGWRDRFNVAPAMRSESTVLDQTTLRDMLRVPAPPVVVEVVSAVWEKLRRVRIVDEDRATPGVFCFSQQTSDGASAHGIALDNEIGINIDHCSSGPTAYLVGIVLEYLLRTALGYSDCSRDMQNTLCSVAVLCGFPELVATRVRDA